MPRGEIEVGYSSRNLNMENNPAHGRTSGTMERELTPGQCILCSQKQPKQHKEYDVKEIISRWSVDFKLDVSEEFASYHTFHLYRCAHCGLDFFYPLISGSDRLYSGLQRFDWYYMDDKWEFQEALKEIKPGSQVLEIGCGMGSFIRIAKENGLRIEGIELSQIDHMSVIKFHQLHRHTYFFFISYFFGKQSFFTF